MEAMGFLVGTSGEEPACPRRRCKREMRMLRYSAVSDSAIPRTVALQVPLSMELSGMLLALSVIAPR